MKIAALYNAKGLIVAGVAVDDGAGYDGPHLVPVASRGKQLGVFDVPESMHKGRIDEICTALRVDVRSLRLVEAKVPPERRGSAPTSKPRKAATK